MIPALRTAARTTRHLADLLKPRIAALLCLTGVSAAMAAGGLPAIELVAFVVAGVGMAGGSAALNCYYDRDIDPKMDRTADRPIPNGDLPAWSALALAAVLLGGASLVAWVALTPAALAYMWLGVASYVGLYTVGLKRRHWSATVLGGSAGAFPVLAGWTAVHPGIWPVSNAALLMAALVFAWTPAHAWALAYVYREDFARVGIPTLPVVADGPTHRSAVWAFALSTILVAAAVLPFAGTVYAAVLVGATGPFLLAFHWYRRNGTERAAVRAFFSSNHFLTVLFLGWAADGFLGRPDSALALGLAVPAAISYCWLWRYGPSLRGIEGGLSLDRDGVIPGTVFGRSIPAPVVAGLAVLVGDRHDGGVES